MDVQKIMTGMKQCSKLLASECKDCPYNNPEKDPKCGKEMLTDALSYIEQLQRTIDNLKILCKDLADLVEPSKLKEYLDQYDTQEGGSNDEPKVSDAPAEEGPAEVE